MADGAGIGIGKAAETSGYIDRGWQAVKIRSQAGWISRGTAILQLHNSTGLQSGSYEPDCGTLYCLPAADEKKFKNFRTRIL